MGPITPKEKIHTPSGKNTLFKMGGSLISILEPVRPPA